MKGRTRGLLAGRPLRRGHKEKRRDKKKAAWRRQLDERRAEERRD